MVFLGVWFLTQLLNGTASLSPVAGAAAGGVAWWAHVGGFVVGMGLCVLLRKRPGPAAAARLDHPPAARAVDLQLR